MKLKLVISARRPVGLPGPEPLVARSKVPRCLVLVKGTEDGKWTLGKWADSKITLTRFKKKPAWVIVSYGFDNAGAEPLPVPTDINWRTA